MDVQNGSTHRCQVYPGSAAVRSSRLARSGREAAQNRGRHLVVGHSTTTPSAIELLGGKPNSTINEAEFDRLYIVTIGKDGAASSMMMHYGEVY